MSGPGQAPVVCQEGGVAVHAADGDAVLQVGKMDILQVEVGRMLDLPGEAAVNGVKNKTIEGAEPLIQKADLNFKTLQRKNIRLIEGEFDKSLPEVLSAVQSVDLVFFDGNHSFDATWKYFSQCLERSHDNSIFIFDDIHWSDEMEQVWDKIKQSKNVRVTIDLFRMGIVFFRKELSKQDFVIKY